MNPTDVYSNLTRQRWSRSNGGRLVMATTVACAAVLGVASCSSSSSSGSEVTTATIATETSPTPESTVQVTQPAREGVSDVDPDDSIALVSIAGVDPFAIEISTCRAEGESTVAFSGESSAGTVVTVDATDMVGGLFVDGPEASYEGTVDLVMVGDTGNIVIGAHGSEADHTSEGGVVDISIGGFVCR